MLGVSRVLVRVLVGCWVLLGCWVLVRVLLGCWVLVRVLGVGGVLGVTRVLVVG